MKDSITKAINEWLLNIDIVKKNIEDIHVDDLPDGTKSLGLQRTGTITLKTYVSGHQQNQYQYMLLLRNISESNQNKIDNFDWLDNLAIKIRDKSNKNDLPQIENKIISKAFALNPIVFETDEDGLITNYALQIYFNINE